jgi:predicted ester cyclase
MTTSSRAEQIALGRRVIEEVFNQGLVAVADDLFIPEIAAGVKRGATRLRVAFPDLHMTIAEEFVMDDRLVQRVTVECTHTGAPFAGVPASGKHATWSGLHLARSVGGKFVELWVEYDYLGLLQQLGIVAQFDLFAD